MSSAHQNRLAPDGIFYLLQPVMITSISGVINVPTGSAVRLVSVAGDTFRVTPDGTTMVDLDRSSMTNDLGLAVQQRAEQERIRKIQPQQAAAQQAAAQQQAAALQHALAQLQADDLAMLQTAEQQRQAASQQQEAAQAQQRQIAEAAQQEREAASQRQAEHQSQAASQLNLRRERDDQLLKDEKQSAARGALDSLERTVAIRQLSGVPALSSSEAAAVTAGARQAAAGDFESQQRLNRIERQIENERWQEHNRQMDREIQAWKENRQPDWFSHP
jgi:hypothetical protein